MGVPLLTIFSGDYHTIDGDNEDDSDNHGGDNDDDDNNKQDENGGGGDGSEDADGCGDDFDGNDDVVNYAGNS